MTTTTPSPLSTEADARSRALRSFTWGLMIDVTVAVLLVLSTAFATIEWTREYWIALGLSVAKSVLQAAVAYVARRVVPPPLTA